MKPFRRGKFEELPDAPRVAHPYFQTRGESVPVVVPGLGKLDAHVRVFGEGPPLYLVHGLMTSSYSWRYVLAPLGKHFTLYAVDLPGNGRTEAPPGASFHPDVLAAFIGEVQRALGIHGCKTIGNSMGGYLCMRLALHDPSVFSRLVNVHSPGVPEARLLALGAALTVPGSGRLLSWMVGRDPQRWVHRNVHYYDESLKSLEEAREYAAPLSTKSGLRAFRGHLRETMAIGPVRQFQRELRARRDRGEPFPMPLLLLYAEKDPMVPPRFGDVMAAAIPDAKLVKLREASHFAHVDAVSRFLPPVLEFLGADPLIG